MQNSVISKAIHFLGWDKPVADSVARYILTDIKTSMVRLDNVLIVTPTRESGRRLREKMAVLCHDRKTAMLGARIVTPLFFIQAQENAAKKAGATLVRSVLIKTLLGLRSDNCRTLFPHGIPQDNHQWAFATAKMIQQLRDDLSDGCLSISSVLKKYATDLQELPRWQDLGKIETIYLENLKKTGYLDPCELKLAHSVSPAIPAEINKIIIASVPAPSLLALTTLGELSKKIKVEILVMAPEKLKDHFDDWGRPWPDKWREYLINIPAPEKNILIAGNPAGQAQRVADLIHEGEYQLADICIGVPDRDVIAYLQDKLETAGITAFDPADRPIKDHHLYHLVHSWRKLADNPAFANLAAFLRNADILDYLQPAMDINSLALLSELDQLQNKALPQTMAEAESALKPEKTATIKRGPPQWRDALRRVQTDSAISSNNFINLKTAIKFANEVLAAVKKEPTHEALRKFLEQIFAFKTITGDSEDDKDFKAVAAHISGILNDIAYAWPHLREFHGPLISRLIADSLDELSIPRRREGAMIDLNGWMELAWNDAPLMTITGFNEGYVPDSQKSDIFLPDALKKILGLRNNETRFARDAYLLALILATRAQQGRVILIAGKTNSAGDPLKPSRLLFRCPDEQLAERAEFIFREIEEEIHNPPFSVSFKLDPSAPLANSKEPVLPAELHATQFRDYLACPFRFYLKHILKMERTETKAELDSRDFGTAMHAILEKFSGNPEINNATDPGLIRKHLNGVLDDYFKMFYGTNNSFPILYAREIAKQRLKAFAAHQAQCASDGWEIVEHELSCQLTISGIEVMGKIDRIDVNRNDGKIRIIDYKTSDSAENPEKKHIKESRKEIPDYARLQDTGNKQWLDLQMPLYWHMFKNTDLSKKHKEVELSYFNLPKAISGSGITIWKDFNESLAESARQSAEKIIERIKRGIFWPPSESVTYDDYETLFNKDMRAYFDGEKIAWFLKKHLNK